MSKTETPKTDAPKTETTALPHEAWVAAARSNFETLQRNINAYWNELAGYENAAYERARAASADLAALTAESIAYVATMTSEWRKMSLEAARRMTESFKV